MNEHLKYVPDGIGSTAKDEVPFKTSVSPILGGSGIGSAAGEIWWPFAIHDNGYGEKKITHLLSGRSFGSRGISVERARECVQALRALSLDWNWTEPKGELWNAVAVGSRPTLEAFGLISPKAQAV
jgi:hypothetical protein